MSIRPIVLWRLVNYVSIFYCDSPCVIITVCLICCGRPFDLFPLFGYHRLSCCGYVFHRPFDVHVCLRAHTWVSWRYRIMCTWAMSVAGNSFPSLAVSSHSHHLCLSSFTLFFFFLLKFSVFSVFPTTVIWPLYWSSCFLWGLRGPADFLFARLCKLPLLVKNLLKCLACVWELPASFYKAVFINSGYKSSARHMLQIYSEAYLVKTLLMVFCSFLW